jgi:hypothetical protein
MGTRKARRGDPWQVDLVSAVAERKSRPKAAENVLGLPKMSLYTTFAVHCQDREN